MTRFDEEKSVIDALYAHVREGVEVPKKVAAAPAVACILWRRSGAGDVEVYLAQRAASLAFLGGYWSFPGGRVEDEDRARHVPDRIAAAVREVREELGIELPEEPSRFVFAGQWVTPDFSPIRFDTHYYLVEIDADADPDWRASGGELQDGAWMTPAEVVAAWESSERFVAAPVLTAVRALAEGMNGAAERCVAAAPLETSGPRIWEITPGIALVPVRTPTLPPATHTNCYVFGCGDVVVIDPATPYDDERAALDRALDHWAERGRRVVEIWLTHHHRDHVGAAAYLRDRLGVPVAAHRATAERVAELVTVDRMLDDGDTLELAGDRPRRVRAVFTPGHAPGHLCILEEETGMLVAGDMIAGIGTILVDPSEGDMGQYLASLRLMKTLAPKALLPAHGGVITAVNEKIDAYIEHRLWRERRVIDALRARDGRTAAELVPDVYADVAPALFPLAERSLRAHLDKLVVDGVAARDGERWIAR